MPLLPISIMAKRYWSSAAGKVTAGLAENNGSLPPGGWLIVTCRLTACTLWSAPVPMLGNKYGNPLFFIPWDSALFISSSRGPKENRLTKFIWKRPIAVR